MSLLVVIPTEPKGYDDFFADTAAKFLTKFGLNVTVSTPEEALNTARMVKPQVCLVVADRSTDKALKKLGVTGDYPIIAVGDAEYQMQCLENGANFFQVTPNWCTLEILHASYWAAASLNMSRPVLLPQYSPTEHTTHGMTLHERWRTVTYKNKKLILPFHEYSVFKLLLQNVNQAVPTEKILGTVWSGFIPDSRRKSLITRIYHLKKSLQVISNIVTIKSGKNWYMLAISD